MKSCANCRFYEWGDGSYCTHKDARTFDRVEGWKYAWPRDASKEGGACGPSAKLWEAKPLPIWKRIFKTGA